jgi:hypothetical protein
MTAAEWTWRDLGDAGRLYLSEALHLYASAFTRVPQDDGSFVTTRQSNVALPRHLKSRVDAGFGVIAGFLPDNYPSNFREFLDDSGRQKAKEKEVEVEERFLGAGEHGAAREYVVGLDYMQTAETLEQPWQSKRPTLIHPALDSQGDVFWICPDPPDRGAAALSLLEDVLSWSSPFPTMAVRGGARFAQIADEAYSTQVLESEAQIRMASHVTHIILDAFDWTTRLLWTAP